MRALALCVLAVGCGTRAGQQPCIDNDYVKCPAQPAAPDMQPPLDTTTPDTATVQEHARAMTEALKVAGRDALLTARAEYHKIRTADECLPEVRKAVAVLVRKERDYDNLMDVADKMAGETTRKLYAEKLERTLLDGSIEADVRLTGANKTTLAINSFICSRVFFHKTFEEMEMKVNLVKGGFRRIVCANSITTLSLDLPEVPMPRGGAGRLPTATVAPDCKSR